MSNFFTFDPEQAKSGFDPLPVGEYEVIVSKVEVTQSKTSGADMLKVELTVRPDEHPEKGIAKRKLFDNIVFMDKTMFKVHQVAGAAGITGAESLQDYAQKLHAAAVRVKTKHEQYNGSTQDRIAIWMASKSQKAGDVGDLVGVGSENPFGSGAINISDDDLPF